MQPRRLDPLTSLLWTLWWLSSQFKVKVRNFSRAWMVLHNQPHPLLLKCHLLPPLFTYSSLATLALLVCVCVCPTFYTQLGLFDKMFLFPGMSFSDSCVPCFFSSFRFLLKCIINKVFHDHLIYNWNLSTSLTSFFIFYFGTKPLLLCYMYLFIYLFFCLHLSWFHLWIYVCLF